jgi:hypothetical protein
MIIQSWLVAAKHQELSSFLCWIDSAILLCARWYLRRVGNMTWYTISIWNKHVYHLFYTNLYSPKLQPRFYLVSYSVIVITNILNSLIGSAVMLVWGLWMPFTLSNLLSFWNCNERWHKSVWSMQQALLQAQTLVHIKFLENRHKERYQLGQLQLSARVGITEILLILRVKKQWHQFRKLSIAEGM